MWKGGRDRAIRASLLGLVLLGISCGASRRHTLGHDDDASAQGGSAALGNDEGAGEAGVAVGEAGDSGVGGRAVAGGAGTGGGSAGGQSSGGQASGGTAGGSGGAAAGGASSGGGGMASGVGGMPSECDESAAVAAPAYCKPRRLDVGEAHACLLQESGEVVCWGYDDVLLYDSTAIAGMSSPLAGPFTRLSVGSGSCAFDAANNPTCWALPAKVELPDEPLLDYVTSDEVFACALRMDGTPLCWGIRSMSVLEAAAPYVQIVVAPGYACGLAADGAAHCAGKNYISQDMTAPATLFRSIVAARYHACGLDVDGLIECWGDNSVGQLDAPSGTFTQLSADGYSTCGVRTDGTLACWGLVYERPPSGTFVEVSVGTQTGMQGLNIDQGCALRADDKVICWGGANKLFQSFPPPAVAAETESLVAVSVGGAVVGRYVPDDRPISGTPDGCGLRPDAEIQCWGNGFAEILPPAGPFEQLSVGAGAACAVRSDGTLACWSAEELEAPAGEFVQVSVANKNACAVGTSGAISCWDWEGALLGEPPTGTFTAVSVSGDQEYEEQTSADYLGHACALRLDGDIVCWRPNAVARVIEGPFIQVASGYGWDYGLRAEGGLARWAARGGDGPYEEEGTYTKIAASDGYVHALHEDGTLAMLSASGEASDAPVADAFVDLSAARDFACGVRADGEFRCWGALLR